MIDQLYCSRSGRMASNNQHRSFRLQQRKSSAILELDMKNVHNNILYSSPQKKRSTDVNAKNNDAVMNCTSISNMEFLKTPTIQNLSSSAVANTTTGIATASVTTTATTAFLHSSKPAPNCYMDTKSANASTSTSTCCIVAALPSLPPPLPPLPQAASNQNLGTLLTSRSSPWTLKPRPSTNLEAFSNATASNSATVDKKKAIGETNATASSTIMPKLPSSRKTAFSAFRKTSTVSTIAATTNASLMNQFPALKDDNSTTGIVSDFFLSHPSDVFGRKEIKKMRNIHNNNYYILHSGSKNHDHDHDECNDNHYYYFDSSCCSSSNNEYDYDEDQDQSLFVTSTPNSTNKKSIPFIDFTPIPMQSSPSSQSNNGMIQYGRYKDNDDISYVQLNDEYQFEHHHQCGFHYDNERDMEGNAQLNESSRRSYSSLSVTSSSNHTDRNSPDCHSSLSLLPFRPKFTISEAGRRAIDIDVDQNCNVSEEQQDHYMTCPTYQHHHPFEYKSNYDTNTVHPLPDYDLDTNTINSLESGRGKSPTSFLEDANDRIPAHLYLKLDLGSSSRVGVPSVATVTAATTRDNTTSFKNNEATLSNVQNVPPPFKKRRVSMDMDDITLKTDTTSTSAASTGPFCVKKKATEIDASTHTLKTMTTLPSSCSSTTLNGLTTCATTRSDRYESPMKPTQHHHVDVPHRGFNNYNNSESTIVQRNDCVSVNKRTTANKMNYHYLEPANHMNGSSQEHKSTTANCSRPVLHAPTPVYATKSAREKELHKQSVYHAFESFNAKNVKEQSSAIAFTSNNTNSTAIQICSASTTDYDYNRKDKTKKGHNYDDNDVPLSPRYINNNNILRDSSFVENEFDILGPPVVHRTRGNIILF